MRVLRILFGLVGLAAAAWLAFGSKPWKAGLGSLEEGEKVRTFHHVISGEWYAALAILLISAAGIWASRWLGRPLSGEFRASPAKITRDMRPLFWIAAGLAVALGAWINSHRLGQSLWGDEEYTMKRMIVGDWSRPKENKLRLREVPWVDTIWRYRTPNNHPLNSILARFSHETFYKENREPMSLHFSEPILRIPAFVAALAGIVALGWFLAVMGFPRAGIMAMLILPLHPWFIRYGVECRGYAFTFLFLPLSLLLLLKAVRRGRWPYWAGFGLSQFLLFFSYPATVYLLVPLNLAALLVIFFGQRNVADRTVLFRRWLTANVFAGILALVAAAPLLLPLKEYLARSGTTANAGLPWIVDNLCYLANGIPWHPWSDSNLNVVALKQYHPGLAWPLVLFPAFFLLIGMVRMFVASRQTRFLLLALLLPWPLFYCLTVSGGALVYHWYAVIVLPAVIALVAMGLEAFPAAASTRTTRNLSMLAMLALYGVWFHSATAGMRVKYLEAPVEPLRESVALSRPEYMNPYRPLDLDGVVTIGFCMATRGYDPAAQVLKSDDVEFLLQLLNSASESGHPVYANFGLPGLARQDFPGIMKIIDDPDYFDVVGILDGMEPFATRWVVKWTGIVPPSGE